MTVHQNCMHTKHLQIRKRIYSIGIMGKETDRSKDISVRYVMEATGVYHESLAYFLDEQGL